MTDLEDRFLKKNTPGKYSSWDDYDENDGKWRRSPDDEDEAENDDDEFRSRLDGTGVSRPLPAPASAVRHGQLRSGNTGVKGVVSDYHAAREEEAYCLRLERREREEALDRAVRGAELRPGELSVAAAAVEERRRNERAARDSHLSRDDAGSESDDEDDDFLRRYRQKRLLQLRTAADRPVFGEIVEASKFEFVDAVDSTDPRVTLIVHMYEPSVRACVILNRMLEVLAPNMPHVRFLRLRTSEAGLNMDPIGLPALALYRGGELVHNLTPVTERLPDSFDVDDVRELLVSCGAVCLRSANATAAPNEETGNSSKSAQAQRMMRVQAAGGGVPEDYDSDDAELDEFCDGLEPTGL